MVKRNEGKESGVTHLRTTNNSCNGDSNNASQKKKRKGYKHAYRSFGVAFSSLCVNTFRGEKQGLNQKKKTNERERV